MGQVSRTPEGLLDLLGTKVGGRYPTGFSDTAVPVVSITELLRGRVLASESGVSLTSAVGDQIDITVPDNQVWLLANVSVEGQLPLAADRLQLKIQLTNLPGSPDPLNQVILSFGPNAAASFSNVHKMGQTQYFASPMALSSGVIIQAEVIDANNFVLPWALHAGIYRLTA